MIVLPIAAAAQTAPATLATATPSPGRTIDINWGFTSFRVEGERFDHTLLGGGFRAPVTSRLALGPEIYHLRGPGQDRDWVFAGKLTIDLLQDDAQAPRSVVPYLVGGGGVLRHSDIVNDEPRKITTGIGNAGIGARLALGRYLYIAPEFRVGLETHWHGGLVIGIRDRRQR
jgi:hypothetical protein